MHARAGQPTSSVSPAGLSRSATPSGCRHRRTCRPSRPAPPQRRHSARPTCNVHGEPSCRPHQVSLANDLPLVYHSSHLGAIGPRALAAHALPARAGAGTIGRGGGRQQRAGKATPRGAGEGRGQGAGRQGAGKGPQQAGRARRTTMCIQPEPHAGRGERSRAVASSKARRCCYLPLPLILCRRQLVRPQVQVLLCLLRCAGQQ